ncbi:ATPase [Flexivirga endophytica]|uniref:ATPase n=1 Tax=Flexivirga endophytica TaxID=1849103 RepID=A0A916T0P5_9MICO|nr:FGGY-family carbohydrate kinase [Flexivirga endophytica]GGB22551.1 ATPase [Flexivirga endophytica]GHB56488.1 ATPase [Flexivirga endophytica]
MTTQTHGSVRRDPATPPAYLGIELGSTRIKACLAGADHQPVAVGSHDWSSRLVDGRWTYVLDELWDGMRAAVADLRGALAAQGAPGLESVRALGVSAMMHGYLAFDEHDELLVPFRTWRNTSTGVAAAELSELLGRNIPLRWSVAHLYQAVLDGEPHVAQVRSVTTLAGYVHRQLTGRGVLGVGDASGMFPIDSRTHDYDHDALARTDELLAAHGFGRKLRDLLPAVQVAGAPAGTLHAAGAALMDPSGSLPAGIPLCPPEGDAGTGMTATCAVAPRTGNVSVGTSIFAMLVLDREPETAHPEVDIVTTPAGDPVAMVHCNNGAAELENWVAVFREFGVAAGCSADADTAFGVLLRAALDGAPDAGGILAYHYLSGEPVVGLDDGRPLLTRADAGSLTFANLARSLVYGVFGALSLGMQVLLRDGVVIDTVVAHGGLFRTEGVAQRLLAAALGVPVGVRAGASEGGAWGIALLAAYLDAAVDRSLTEFLDCEVFATSELEVVTPDPADVRGYSQFLERYSAGLTVERTAVDALDRAVAVSERQVQA